MNLFWYTWGVESPPPFSSGSFKVLNEILVVTGILGQGATLKIYPHCRNPEPPCWNPYVEVDVASFWSFGFLAAFELVKNPEDGAGGEKHG